MTYAEANRLAEESGKLLHDRAVGDVKRFLGTQIRGQAEKGKFEVKIYLADLYFTCLTPSAAEITAEEWLKGNGYTFQKIMRERERFFDISWR